MAPAAERNRDWTRLPPELLHKIATHLQELPDLFRFRFVCCSWRSSTSNYFPILSSHLPWLLLPSFQTTPATFNRRFFSLSEHRIYTIPLPETRNKVIFPSSRGLLVLGDLNLTSSNQNISISLLNPITLTLTPLPPIPLRMWRSSDVQLFAAKPFAAKLFASNLVAVLSFTERCVFFARIGASEWKRVPIFCYRGSNFTNHNGRFFVLSGSTGVFDAATGKKVAAFPLSRPIHPPVQHVQSIETYLVNSPSGELLLVKHLRSSRNLFYVHRLEESKSDPPELKWTEVKSIGDNVLFVDNEDAMCIAATDFKGFRNCIYFVDHQGCSRDYIENLKERGVWRFDMQRSQAELLYSFSLHFPMDLRQVMWFAPRLCENGT